MLLDILIIGGLVYGLAKFLNATAFKSVTAAPWIAWSLTIVVLIASFLGLFMSQVFAYKAIAMDVGVPSLASSGPKPNFVLPFLFAWLFFASLNRKRKPSFESASSAPEKTSQTPKTAIVSGPEKAAPEPVPAAPTNHQLSGGPADRHWAQALTELEGGERQAGLWARCFAEAQGNESLAQANYLSARARHLADEHRARILKTQQAEEQAKRDAETARLADERRRYDTLPKGRCPNCNEVIPLSAQECSKCHAAFTPGSAWKVLPINDA